RLVGGLGPSQGKRRLTLSRTYHGEDRARCGDHVGSASEEEKAAIIQETYVPGISVSLVARPTSCSLAAALCERRAVSGGRWRGCSGSVRVRRVAAAGPPIATAARKKTFEQEDLRERDPAPRADLVQKKTTVARFAKLPDLQRAAVDLVSSRPKAWLSDG